MHRVSDHLCDRHPYSDQPFDQTYNPQEVTRAYGARAIPKYAELLAIKGLSDEDRCRALQDLRALLSSPMYKYTDVTMELTVLCADLTQSTSAKIRTNAALVVASLVLCEIDTLNEPSDEVVMAAATRLLSDNDENVVAAGCRIFVNLTVTNYGCLLLASKKSAVAMLLNMLATANKLPTRTVDLLVEIIANLTRNSEGVCTCAQLFVTVPVLTLIKKPRLCRAETLLHSAMVITNIAINDRAKREAIEVGAVELCLKALSIVLLGHVRCESDEIRNELTRCLVAAVMGLSTDEDAKLRVVECGVEPLAQCLTHTSAIVRQNASITINLACDLPRGLAAFTQRLLRSPNRLLTVLGIKAVPFLNGNISSFDYFNTPPAVTAVAAFQEKDAHGTADQIVQTLGMLDNLIKALLKSEVPLETQQDIAKLIQRIGQTDSSYQRRVGKCMMNYSLPDSLILQMLSLTRAELKLMCED